MAFGFPAYHTDRYEVPDEKIDLHELVLAAISALGWSIKLESKKVIRASTSMSIWSWGERITITFEADDTITITSKCALPTQCLDWGKNKTNVERFLARLSKLESTDSDSW